MIYIYIYHDITEYGRRKYKIAGLTIFVWLHKFAHYVLANLTEYPIIYPP